MAIIAQCPKCLSTDIRLAPHPSDPLDLRARDLVVFCATCTAKMCLDVVTWVKL